MFIINQYKNSITFVKNDINGKITQINEIAKVRTKANSKSGTHMILHKRESKFVEE